jgi:flagellar biosynthetic protein FlhB
MSEEDKHSKTEQPTQKRLDESRKKDAPPQSRDLTSTVTLLAAIIALSTTGSFMVSTMQKSSQELLAQVGTFQVTAASVHNLMIKLIGTMGIVLGPFMLAVMAAGIAVNFAQGGIVFSWEKLSVKYDKLNPLKGAKKLLNKDSLVEVVKSFLKIAIIGYVAYRVIREQTDSLAYLSERDIADIFLFVGRLIFRIVVNSCGVLLVLALLDLAFVKWRYQQNLRMTKQEVKQEHRDSEGDPQIKGKIRRAQFEQSRRRLMKIIPTADVVITNPTHFAIALKYDREKMVAPVVIAKGADHLALRIKDIARQNRVMLVENRFLARELYATVKEGQAIPESLYAAVAEVLAYVFSLRGKI